MANSSDQIQADIARTRARMSSQLDQATRPYGASAPAMGGRAYTGAPAMGGRAYTPAPSAQLDLSVEGIVTQMRQRPLLTLGLGLIAGSLLQDYLGGDEGSSTSTALATRPSYPTYNTQATTSYGQPGSTVRQGVSNATRSVGSAAQSAGDVVADTASGVVDTARDAASAVVDTTVDVASRVADTTVDVASRVADTTVDAAYQTMDAVGYVAEEAYERAGDLTSTVTNFVSNSPLMALGLSLAAGSLLQRYLRGGSTTTRTGYSSYSSSAPAYPPTYGSYGTSGTYARPGAAVGQAGRDVAGAVGNAADAVGDAAQATGRAVTTAAGRAVDTTVDAASAVAGTAVDAASAVADATVDVAQRAGNVAVDAAGYVVDTASDAAGYVAETVTDLWPTITRQVQQRPLATLGVAMVAGSLLQPTLAPHVQAVTSDVRDLWNTVSGTVGDLTNLPEPPEVQRIKDAIVPATVDRTRQMINRDAREYLDSSLEGIIGQTSLRAGVIAAVTDRAEDLVSARLPTFLNGLGGTTGLLLLGLTGAILEARNQAQQGQGHTISNVRTALSQSIVQNAQEQLSRFFPEFRDQLQSQASSNATQDCPNCGAQIAPNSRFCPNCGRAVSQGASV